MSFRIPPAAIVAEHLGLCPVDKRNRFLRELLAHTTAGLCIIEGNEKAAEAIYSLADAIVSRSTYNER